MKCLYVYNPKSGKQSHEKNTCYIVSKLKSKYDVVDVKATTKRGDAGKYAMDACGVYDVLVISGGDGTVNEVINAIAIKNDRPKIGYIPTGTTNDLAHSLKIPTKIKKALNIILNGKTTKHDIFKINNMFGIYVCAFGIFTASSYTASQNQKKTFGKLAYYFTGVKEIGSAKKFHLTLEGNNYLVEDDVILGIIANSRYVSGYKINKMAKCDDGYVNVILFKERKKKGISLKMLLKVIRLFLFGVTTLNNSKDCVILKLNKFRIDFKENPTINVDGENAFNGSFELEVLKEHIEIFVKG